MPPLTVCGGARESVRHLSRSCFFMETRPNGNAAIASILGLTRCAWMLVQRRDKPAPITYGIGDPETKPGLVPMRSRRNTKSLQNGMRQNLRSRADIARCARKQWFRGAVSFSSTTITSVATRTKKPAASVFAESFATAATQCYGRLKTKSGTRKRWRTSPAMRDQGPRRPILPDYGGAGEVLIRFPYAG